MVEVVCGGCRYDERYTVAVRDHDAGVKPRIAPTDTACTYAQLRMQNLQMNLYIYRTKLTPQGGNAEIGVRSSKSSSTTYRYLRPHIHWKQHDVSMCADAVPCRYMGTRSGM